MIKFDFNEYFPATITLLYEVPAGVFQHINTCSVENTDTVDRIVNLYITRAEEGHTEELVTMDWNMQAGLLRGGLGEDIPLRPGDKIYYGADVADKVELALHLGR